MVAVLLERVESDEKNDDVSCALGSCYEGESGKVIAYANNFGDSMLVRELLDSCGFALSAQSASDAIRGKAAFYGAVICHETGQDEQTISLLSTLRASRVLILSNCTDEHTVVSLLDQGAHHYIHVNQSMTLLAARTEAALRQHNAVAKRPFIVGDIHFDIQKRSVSRAGKAVDLSPKEYELAYYLFANADRVIGNDELMSAVWLLPAYMDTRRIDTAACRVRKKLGLFHAQGWELKRIRRVGYRLLQLDVSAEGIAEANVA